MNFFELKFGLCLSSFVLAVLPACSGFAETAECRSTNAAADERPNVVWIYIDDMSDWLGCYGDELAQTEHIDQLARRGIRFENAFMPSPVCSTTRSALITGTMQTTFGLHHHRTMIKHPLPEGVSTVPELFRAAGYVTFNLTKADYNFERDTDSMYSPGLRLPKVRGHFDGAALDWLGQLKGRPFFGQFQLKGGKIGGEAGSKFPAETRFSPESITVPPYYPDTPVIRNAIARHYEQIAQTDVEVGRILKALTDNGLIENTIVLLFTDHGSPLPRSKQFLYEEGVKVPLIVYLPKRWRQQAPAEAVRTDLVSGVDIPVTSLALAGIEVPEWMEGNNFFASHYQPKKYLIQARDRCGIAIDRIRAVRSENYRYIKNFMTDRPLYQSNYRDNFATFVDLRNQYAANELTPRQASYHDASQRPAEELYDLKKDPDQLSNLATVPRYQDVLREHRQVLNEWIDRTGDQGQFPESKESLKQVFDVADGKVTCPEFDFLKSETR